MELATQRRTLRIRGAAKFRMLLMIIIRIPSRCALRDNAVVGVGALARAGCPCGLAVRGPLVFLCHDLRGMCLHSNATETMATLMGF